LSDTYLQFYYNYSAYDPTTGEVYQPGLVTWNLPYTGVDGPGLESEAFGFEISYASNVLQGLFYPGDSIGTYLSFHPENGSLYISSAVDDSNFNATYPSPSPYFQNISNFHLCYQYYSGYYYQSIAWVTTQPPQNPSCEPVDLSLELI
jgi:hypothetical protein